MKFRLHLLLSLLVPVCSPPALQATDWDPEDTDFDPAIESVIVQGSTRIGDPTPFFKEGFNIQSYTHIEAKADDNLGATIWFSLIVPFVPGQTGPQEGAFLVLSVDQASDLIRFLEKAIQAPEKEKSFGKIFQEGKNEIWTVKVDPGDESLPVVLEMEVNEETDRYHFGINPATKLVDTLKKVSAQANEIASGGQ